MRAIDKQKIDDGDHETGDGGTVTDLKVQLATGHCDNRTQFKATQLWLDVACKFHMGMKSKRHWQRFKAYNDCFKCSAAINWLSEYLQSLKPDSTITKRQAADLLQSFQDFQIVEDVRGSEFNKRMDIDHRLLKFNIDVIRERSSRFLSPTGTSDIGSIQTENCEGRASEFPCPELVSSYLCIRLGLANMQVAQETLAGTTLDLKNVYVNVSNHSNRDNFPSVIPNWLVDLITSLARWPESFEENYRICLPNMLTIIFKYLEQNIAHFAGIDATVEILMRFHGMKSIHIVEQYCKDTIDEGKSEVDESKKEAFTAEKSHNVLTQDKAQCPITRNYCGMSMRELTRKSDPDYDLAHCLQHLTLLINPAKRTNLINLFELLRSLLFNPTLFNDNIFHNWLDHVSKVIMGSSDDKAHIYIRDMIMFESQNVFKVPRVLAGICVDCNAKVKSGKRKLCMSIETKRSLRRSYLLNAVFNYL